MDFVTWFRSVVVGGTRQLVVPREIKELPCRCTRKGSERPFTISRQGDGWIHTENGCTIRDP